MFNEKLKKQIIEVWNEYAHTIRSEKDDEGNLINKIDDGRLYAIEVVKIIMHNFLKGDFNVHEFKNALDSYNKHNNLWGFSAKYGQLYFNQLIKANEQNIEKLTLMLRDLITEPKSLRDALSKIDTLEKFTLSIYSKTKDKHNAPYPGAVGFFLSYFWQMYNHQKWPILYSTLLSSFRELGVWDDQKTQKETYEQYYRVYNEIKDTIEDVSTKIVTFWEVEHAFWNYKNKPVHEPYIAPKNETVLPKAQTNVVAPPQAVKKELELTESETIEIRDYVIPRLSRYLDAYNQQGESKNEATPDFNQVVAEAFKQMDFEVDIQDQSAQFNAYAIVKSREENIAFIVDAIENSVDYFRMDKRVMKAYINDHCLDLKRQGYKKIAYFAVCHQFEQEYHELVSYLQWNTDIKKMTLISSEALLYMLAYKIKNRTSLLQLVEKIARFSTLVEANSIASELRK